MVRNNMELEKTGLKLTGSTVLNYFLSSVTVPVSFTSTPVNQIVREGEETTFHCTATGNPTPVITWLKDEKTVASGETLTFTASRNYSGHYLCSAENGLGVKINASADLEVQCKIECFSPIC